MGQAFGIVGCLLWCWGRGWCCPELGWSRGWDPTRRVVPPSPGAKGTSCIPGHWCDVPLQHRAATVGSPVPPLPHTQVLKEMAKFMFLPLNQIFRKSRREISLVSAGFDEFSLCVCLLEIVSPDQWLRLLFFPRRNTLLQLLLVPNNERIIHLNVILCFFCGEVQWFSAPGDVVAVFSLWIFSYSGSETDALKTVSNFATTKSSGNHFSRKISKTLSHLHSREYSVMLCGGKSLTHALVLQSNPKLVPLFGNISCIVFGLEESHYFRISSVETGTCFLWTVQQNHELLVIN